MYDMRRQRTCVDPFLHVWTRLKISFYCCDGAVKRSLMVSVPVQFLRDSSLSQSRLRLRAGPN
jgi:hypothetical protein